MSIPSPFIFTKHGLSYRVELDAHYISDEEMQTLRRYIANLNDENERLRELVARMAHVLRADDEWRDPFYCNPYCADQFNCRSDDCVEVLCPIVEAMRELGVEVEG